MKQEKHHITKCFNFGNISDNSTVSSLKSHLSNKTALMFGSGLDFLNQLVLNAQNYISNRYSKECFEMLSKKLAANFLFVDTLDESIDSQFNLIEGMEVAKN